jgi:hypothetical protein
MAQLLYLGGFLLVVIGFIKLISAKTGNIENERQAQMLSVKSEKIGSIADSLSHRWKS